HLDVVELAEADTGLEVRLDLGDGVLEATQRLDGEAIGQHDAVADDARLGVARDRAALDEHTRDVAELRGAEHLADLGETRLRLLELGLEHALERGLHVVDRVVDDVVEADVDALAGGGLAGLRVRADVEAEHDRVVDRREVDVALGDRADAAVDDAQLHAVVHLDLQERLLERLDGTRHVALDDEVERLDLALLEGLREVLERHALAGLRECRVALDSLALLGDLAGGAVVLRHEEQVAGARDRVEALHLDGTRRCRLLHALAVLVDHGAHAAVGRARD